MENQMHYTETQIKMQEQLKAGFANGNVPSNWELVGIAWRIESGRAIVSPKGRFAVEKDCNDGTIELTGNGGQHYTFKTVSIYAGIATGQLKVEYR